MSIDDIARHAADNDNVKVTRSVQEIMDEVNEAAAKNLDEFKPPKESTKDALNLSDETNKLNPEKSDDVVEKIINNSQLARKNKILDEIDLVKKKADDVRKTIENKFDKIDRLGTREEIAALMQERYDDAAELNKLLEVARKSDLAPEHLDEILTMLDDTYRVIGDQVHMFHKRTLQEFARKHDLVILLRDCNEEGFRFMLQKGYIPKPEAIKIKTLKEGPNRGLVAFVDPEANIADPHLSNLQDGVRKYLNELNNQQLPGIEKFKADDYAGRYKHYVEHLEGKGFRVDANDSFLIKKRGTNEKIFGDYDLHGVYDKKTGKHIPIEDKDYWIKLMNEELGLTDDMIQHWAHDAWVDRNDFVKAGANAGPLHEKGMSALYDENGILKEVKIKDSHQFVSYYSQQFGHNLLKETYPKFFTDYMLIHYE